MAISVNSIEYRNIWTKKIIGMELTNEERSALASAGSVIPTLTANAVWDKLIKPAELLGKVDVTKFPFYVKFPVVTTNNAATSQAIGTDISESSDVIGYVELTPHEYVKMIRVGMDIQYMSLEPVHDWIVENLVGKIRQKINEDILIGTGTNELTGIAASVNASGTPLPDEIDKEDILSVMGSLPNQYQQDAIWIMSPDMFYSNIMSLTTLNNYIINDSFEFKLFGHDVVLMSEAVISSKENIFYGDPKAYKVNIFKEMDVKPFETADTTDLKWRGACLVNGQLLDTSAFVRFAQT